MSSPHPLNLAVIAELLHLQRQGQLRRCEAMGFSLTVLEALRRPELVSLLANAVVPWWVLQGNDNVIQRILSQEQAIRAQDDEIDRKLLLGGSTKMIGAFHGLSNQEVAVRRRLLRLDDRKGRWPVLTEAQDAELWNRARDAITERNIDRTDENAVCALIEEISAQMKLPLSVLWNTVQKWIEQGLL